MHNPSSIQIKGQYILHRSLFDQKEGHAVLHNLKLILEIDLSVRKGRGVLNTPHMYLYFWSYVSFEDALMGRMQYAPT